MKTCLDTNAIIHYLHGDTRATEIIDRVLHLYVPSIVVLESIHVARKIFYRLRKRPTTRHCSNS